MLLLMTNPNLMGSGLPFPIQEILFVGNGRPAPNFVRHMNGAKLGEVQPDPFLLFNYNERDFSICRLHPARLCAKTSW
jgi:hypothetical protein